MCGIFAIFAKDGTPLVPKMYYGRLHALRELAYRQSGKQRHGVAMVHERLRIIGAQNGDQPFFSAEANIALVANGEIYNYKELAAKIRRTRLNYKPKSDCNVIIELYEDYGVELLNYITGIFAFVLYDKSCKKIMVARDPFGIIPLYMGEDDSGNLWFASEMKCLVDCCSYIEAFQPGEMRFGHAGNLKKQQFFKEPWLTEIPTMEADLLMLRNKLINAVRSHLQCDVHFGSLLSGGIDSSLVSSIATNIMRERDPNYKLKTFSVGLKNAPDFSAARAVADYIKSDHTEVVFSTADAMDGIRDVIYHLETYDVTTIRCSLPMLLLARYIKSIGIKMILSGEGADEIFGGYLYFFKAPNLVEFHKELVKRLSQLHMSDCLRANKVTMAKGLELRVPFLDTAFVNYVMSIRPQDKIPGPLNAFNSIQKHRLEKYILREAFSKNFLPKEVLWRQKEQFSDGVGYSWIDTIRSETTQHVSNSDFDNAANLYPVNTPTTKEAYYYREIFTEMFPGQSNAATVKRWVPRLDWGCSEDPSGRAQTNHKVQQ